VKIRFLRSAAADLDWFFSYYQSVFPAGLATAKEGYRRTKLLLSQNPEAGKPSDLEGLREFPVMRTPFSFIYRVTPRSVEVVRVWDQRSKRLAKWI